MPDGSLAALVATLAALTSLHPATAQEAAGLLERQNLTGNWNGIRPAFSAHGFEPYLTYTGVTWSNLAGGNDTGAVVDGYLDFGTDIDLAKLGGWSGLGLHADFHWWQGRQPTKVLIGGTPAMALSDWEAASAFRVYNLYLRQAFADDRWVVKLGQIAADTDFMVSRYGGMFLNGAFGDLPSQNLNIDAPVYPLAAPGFFTLVQPMSWLTGRFGAYTGDAGDDFTNNHGFGWNLGNNAGYTFFSELAAGVADGSSGGSLPGTYTLGGIYATGGPDQFGSGAERSSHYELYAMIDQALVVDAHGAPTVGVFARMTGSPQEARNVVGIYADAGLDWFGPLAWRPRDALGVAVSVLRFTPDFEHQSQESGMPVGGGETVFEMTYQAAIAPWLVVQPDLQFFPDPPSGRPDAYALGGQLVVIF
jgi:porin